MKPKRLSSSWQEGSAALLTALALAMPCGLTAATLTVTTTDDNGSGSLRQAIQDAASGDRIEIWVTGTIFLTNGTLMITNDVNIVGFSDANVALSGNGIARIVSIASNSVVSISGVAFRNGRAPADEASGGAIYNSGTLVLEACEFSNNSAAHGVAGANVIGNPNCLLFPFECVGGRGTPGGSGGGIYNRGNLTVRECSFRQNSGGTGGAGGSGGPGWGGPGGPGGYGGAIHNGGAATLLFCAFDNNSGGVGGPGGPGSMVGGPGGSGGNGGGICNGGTLSLTSCTFSRNSGGLGGSGPGGGGSGGSGGAIYNLSSDATLIACTIASNSVPAGTFSSGGGGSCGTAGGIWGFNTHLRNTIVAANTIRGGVCASYEVARRDVSGSFISEGHNLIGVVDVYSDFTNGINGDLVGTPDVPIDPHLGPLQNNLGTTLTMALMPGSPALDTGDDALLATPFDLASDQRGLPRKSGPHVDIGTYEFQTPGPFWTPTRAPVTNWAALASSADGRILVAAVKGGPIYVSSDSGATWNLTSAPHTNWSAVASSADGSCLVATVSVFDGSQYQSGGPIYVSANAGLTWTQTSAPITNWSAVSCSADGSKLVAVSGGYVVYITSAPPGPIYRSIDFGATWLPTSVTGANCTSLASAADGSKLVAASYLSPLSFSSDSGSTWHDVTPTFAYLVSVASSADGTRLLAGTFDPFHPPGTGGHFNTVISTNSGATWDYSPGGAQGRGYVASSADGTTLIAAGGPNGFGRPGPILISTNAGETWTANNSPVDKWRGVVCSADGSKIAAAADGGGIWTFQSVPTPKLRIASSSTNLVLSWIVPSRDFVLQQSADLITTSWTDISIPVSLNLTNLQQEAVLVPQSAHRFFRLRN